MKVSIVIMAHPSRAKFIPYLKKELGDVKVVFDEKNNIWDTCRRSWLAHDFSSDYCIVLQEDVIIGENFYERLIELLKEKKDCVYSLYLGNRDKFKKEVEEIKKKGGSYLVKKNIHHEIALVFPTKRVKEMVEFCDKIPSNLDKKINNYVLKNKLNVIFPLPTLVNHRNHESLFNGNKSNPASRVSIWF